jgi:hypothetical protein
MTKKLDLIYEAMQEALAQGLLDRIRSGEATAADMNVARQLLKDNNITSVPKPGDPIANLVHTLPFTGDEDNHPAYRN